MTAGIEGREATDAEEPVRLSARAVAWRLIVVVGCLVALTVAQFTDTDDYFPLSRLSQYALAPGRDGVVKSTYILADNADGEQVRVPLNATGVGIGRAEVEGQLGRIIDDPSLLHAIANAWAQLHPDQPQYERLYLKRDVYQLVDGKPAGDRETLELAVWEIE
jgi:hypothetical protein